MRPDTLPELGAPCIFCIPTETGWISRLGGQFACGGGPSVGRQVCKEKCWAEDLAFSFCPVQAN